VKWFPPHLRDAGVVGVERKIELIVVTSTRGVTYRGACEGGVDPAHNRLMKWFATDPRAPFHVWVDSEGIEAFRIRDHRELVLPDGIAWPGIGLRAEVVCVAGWYATALVACPGEGSMLPATRTLLAKTLLELIAERGLQPTDLTCASEHGALAYPGDCVEDLVNEIRATAPPNNPQNQVHYVTGMDLRPIAALRRALAALGYYAQVPTVDAVGSAASWDAADQFALVSFQTKRGLFVSGYLDRVTEAALREALAGRTLAPFAEISPIQYGAPPPMESLLSAWVNAPGPTGSVHPSLQLGEHPRVEDHSPENPGLGTEPYCSGLGEYNPPPQDPAAPLIVKW